MSVPKYSSGDIIKLKSDHDDKRIILCVCPQEPGGLIRYLIKYLDTDEYPPLVIEEPAIDKYYDVF
jgi:hypothetical protein